MSERAISFFSMEIGLEKGMPTYAGGLGILAGDTVRSAADMEVPMAAITLLHRKGHFNQRLGSDGTQIEEPVEWEIEKFLEKMPPLVSVDLEGRKVNVCCWRYEVVGTGGYRVPVYFLDTDLPENSEWDRKITDCLYGGDDRYRLCQEAILGIGGVRMLGALGLSNIQMFHMNEGHSSLLALELLYEEAARNGRSTPTHEDIETVRKKCVFTTHTPVPAGHDQFPLDLATRVLGARRLLLDMKEVFCCEGLLNMTYLALNLSHYVNGVARRHSEISKHMFARYIIHSITNGVHAATWAAKPVQNLFDHYIPGWRQDNFSLRYALNIPKWELSQAHTEAKQALIHHVNSKSGLGMNTYHFTIGFARRAAAYKRADLLFTDMERLKGIAKKFEGIQIIFAGKAHPKDREGKEMIKRIFQMKELLKNEIKIAYLENYDMELSREIAAGVDLWLNTPEPPLEASGTSGMKAAINGVPSLSILDGWWIEGCIEGITGWAIGEAVPANGKPDDRVRDASFLYDKLENAVLPLFYNQRENYAEVMRHAIALNGSFFNTQRMLLQYVLNAYFL